MFTQFPALAQTKAQEADLCYEKVASECEEGFDSLDDRKWWTDRYRLFESRGFQLSSRYRPGLKALDDSDLFSGIDTDVVSGREMIDAIRFSDGKAVTIKKVPYRPGSREVKIATILSSPENLKDRRNHCIPILDSFHDTIDDPRLVFLVMPKLHSSNDPHPKSVGDVVEFMRQTLEGLEFMHGRDIAHRDISLASIMVDSDTRKQSLQHSISEKTNTNHVRYFISNFESCQDLNTLPTFKSVAAVPERGQYPPELSGDNDVPFSGDVFALGTLFKKNFITPYSNFDTLIPLIKQMTARDPKKRPSMAVARSRFEMLVRNWNGSTLRWRLRPTHEKIGPRFVRTCAAIVREVLHLPSRVATSASLLMKQQSLRFLTKVHYAFRPYQIATF